MPPKPKFTRDQIIAAALNIVSAEGIEGLTAQRLSRELGSSASPIFTVFDNMKEIQDRVRQAAMAKFEAGGPHSPGMPAFKEIGMKMVLFGLREPKLYQLLFMRENPEAVTFGDIFGILGPTAQACLDTIMADYGLEEGAARRLFEHMWIFTFGTGGLCATGMCHFREEALSELLSSQFHALLMLAQSEKAEKSDRERKSL